MGATIWNPLRLEGRGLHTGAPVAVVLLPRSEPGILFRRTDLPGTPCVPAAPSFLAEATRHTTLCHGPASVATVEHLLAACWGLDVAGLTVEVDGPELPIGDGSALLWVEAFREAGFAPVDDPRLDAVFPRSEVSVTHGDSSLTLAPASSWSVHFAGVFPDGTRHEALWTHETDFAAELAGARTFCRLSEVIALRRAGLIAGGSPGNALVWMDVPVTEALAREVRAWWPDATLSATPEGLLSPQRLRWPDECVRHKLLDLLGDLALLRPLRPCRVEAIQGGHALTHELVRRVRAQGWASADTCGE